MKWKETCVLITGGGGFIGTHLVQRLLEKQATITVIDLFKGDCPPSLTEFKDKIELLNADITQPLGTPHESFDFIFHLAALSSPVQCEQQPNAAFKVNVQGTYNILKFAQQAQSKKVIFASAAALYGRYPKPLPVSEKNPIDIINSVYNATKRIGETLCMDFHNTYKLPYVFFRIFNAYGPKQSPNYLIPSLISQARQKKKIVVLNENTRRDFTFVGDIVDAFIKAAESNYCGGPINLGTGKEFSVGDLARKIAAFFDVKVESLNKEVFGPTRLVCDNSLAKQVLNWTPEVDIDKGIKITIEWFQASFGKKEQLKRT